MKRSILAAAVAAISLTACGASVKMAMQMDKAHQQKLAASRMTVSDVTSSVKNVPTQFLTDIKAIWNPT